MGSDASPQDGAGEDAPDAVAGSAARTQTSSPGPAPRSPAAAGSSSSASKLRKRTKTGCLTCRKRRVKCGEERPTCYNCQKSKRHCEGYTQRVIFKSPIGNWPGGQPDGGTTLQYHTGMLPGSGSSRMAPPPLQLQPQLLSHHHQISPHDHHHPGMMHGFAGYGQHGQMISPHTPTTPMTPADPLSAGPYANLGPNGVPHFLAQHQQQQPFVRASWHTSTYHELQISPGVAGQGFVMGAGFGVPPGVPAPQNQSPDHRVPGYVFGDAGRGPSDQSWGRPTHHGPVPGAEEPYATFPRASRPGEEYVLATSTAEQIKTEHMEMLPSNMPLAGHAQHYHEQFKSESITGRILQPAAVPSTLLGDIVLDAGIPEEITISNPNDLLQGAAIEAQDDDYFDVDDEVDTTSAKDQHEDFSLMRQIHQHGTMTLRYGARFDGGILGQYHAEWHASPLRNPRTARVFAHFIHATGPSLSIFERVPKQTQALFDSPVKRQSLWTVTLPMRALHNHGLLHAMLALASLHIANVQGADSTPSIKHYSYALRSVHNAVDTQKKRHRVETLAATLLLGYYEVMSADHAKWCSHLLGARQLLREIGYPALTKHAQQLRAEATGIPSGQCPERALQSAIDETLVSTISGWRVEYGRVDHVQDLETQLSEVSSLGQVPADARVDLDTYDLYQDLWWWFARQDAYQSIVSGNGLLMSYARWSDCPPRARVGRPDATYGTHDHIILLLGRIAAFSARDRRRKVSVIKTNGGQWRPPPGGVFEGLGRMPPPPGMGAGPPPSQPSAGKGPQVPPAGMQPGSQPPPKAPQVPFMGMRPSSSTTWMHPSYENPNQPNVSSPTSSDDSTPEEEARAAAVREWTSLRSALNTVGSHLGPTFQPTEAAGDEGPFGPPIYYRQFDIAVLNALYEMCHIILFRAHPGMPPASMIAAGVASAFTREPALRIGRIATGMFNMTLPPLPNHPPPHHHSQRGLDPSVSGIVCEMTMPLFFSGVQYQTPPQRAWFADRLRQIEMVAGFATAGMIGHGCETAWRRAAAAGRGPPYERCGHWAAPDEDDGSAGARPPWSVGVRGGEGDAPPPQGLEGQQGLRTEGLPVRVGGLGTGSR